MRGIYKNKKVGVLMGGFSPEREISLKTGGAVEGALKGRGYDTVAIDCTPRLARQLREAGVEVAFVALHGPYGEDGCVQGLLEWLQIPYTGSGPLASALCMDKAVLNGLSRDLGVCLPAESVWDARHESEGAFLARLGLKPPVVVKPSREGSSINITLVRDRSELSQALKRALASDSKILVQEYVEGKEVTVSVLKGQSLPSVEIVPKKIFYDYDAKYTKGMSEYVVPARLSEPCLKELASVSEKLFRAIDCSGFIRVDFIVGREREKPYFLEINTIPGMTETSLFPKAAKAAGIDFEELCEILLDDASLKVGKEQPCPR